MDFDKWDHGEIDLNALANGFFRTLRTGGTAIVWYDLWKITKLRSAFEDAGFGMFRIIIWQKRNPVPLNSKVSYLSNSREMALVCVKGSTPTFNSSYDDGMYYCSIPRHNGNRIHPTQKCVRLFSELVKKHSNPGDMIINPFLGSGTTAMAALAGGGEEICRMRYRSRICNCRTIAVISCLNQPKEICFSNLPNQTAKVLATLSQAAERVSRAVQRRLLRIDEV